MKEFIGKKLVNSPKWTELDCIKGMMTTDFLFRG